MMRYLLSIMLLGSCGHAAAAFDHQHALWDELLKKHVVWIDGGHGSQVDYRGFQHDREQLARYLNTLSDVTPSTFDSWSKNQQLAFLINAYNAFTIELVLTRYPDLDSIKELGWLFRSPWKKRSFTLLGEKRHLDDIEHGLIRAPGVYDEPRIHVAVVCASIGCPALRDEAYTARDLDTQMEDSFRRFLGDKSRNRYDSSSDTLRVSKIFDWYEADFTQGHGGFHSLTDVFARYAELLTDDPATQRRIREREVPIRHLDYDWALNDVRA